MLNSFLTLDVTEELCHQIRTRNFQEVYQYIKIVLAERFIVSMQCIRFYFQFIWTFDADGSFIILNKMFFVPIWSKCDQTLFVF